MAIEQLRTFCSILLGFAFFFWAWALKNTAAMTDGSSWDYGLVSFGSVLLTSSYVLGMANAGKVPPKKSVGGILFLLSSLLVSLNYGVGAAVGFIVMGRPGFGIYCVIFTFIWLAIVGYSHEMLKRSSINTSESTPLSA